MRSGALPSRSLSSAPDSGTGSILLIDGAAYQDVYTTCTATLDTNCDNAGIVFGYVDAQNYWVRIYSKAQQKRLLYQVSSGSWTQRSSTPFPITGGSPFTVVATSRAGDMVGYAATMPGVQRQARLYKRKDDGTLTTVTTNGTALSLTRP